MHVDSVQDQTKHTTDKKGLVAVVLGNAVEFFDFGVYATFAVMIGHTFFPSDSGFVSLMLSLIAFGIGFIVRPLGAVVIGAYADRVGRKPAMLLTMVLMGIGTGGLAILPGYETIGVAAPILLVIIRLLQGLAWGGEAGPATTYILEAAPPHKRGSYACWQVVAQGLAAVAAGLVGYGLSLVLTDQQMSEFGWRIPFVIGLVILPIGLYLRRNLHETFHGQGEETKTVDVVKTVVGSHRKKIILGVLVLSGSTITQYFLNYMTTFALTELKLSTSISMFSTLIVGGVMAVFAVVGGRLCDKFGRKKVIIIPRLVLLIILLPLMQIISSHPSTGVFLASVAILTALHGMSGAALIVLLVESFPRSIRSTGFSIVYALGIAGFGGTAQIIIAWLIGTTGSAMSPALYLIVANIACIVASYLSIETKPESKQVESQCQLKEQRA